MRHYYLTLVFLLFPFFLLGQTNKKQYNYRMPMDLRIYLSGSFAELRSDHFHSGIDIRTAGVEGQKVFAIEDGFVSRVAVSPYGFGKAVYISHPKTGHLSVYAHLQRFEGSIASYVKNQQYAAKSFTVNLYPEAGLLPVKKGDLIGFSGNSGSSGGPHLHFEIRDGASQEILNPLDFGFAIKDFIRPSVQRLAVYPEDLYSTVKGINNPAFFEVQGWGENHRIKENEVVKAFGNISFGITTHDTHNDTPNKNGVYSIELFIDSLLLFAFKADRFSFDETRYVNSMIDYTFFIKNQSRIVRTAIDPYNKLGLYDYVKSNGIFNVEDNKTYHAEYLVKDYNGNISRLPFVIKGEKPVAPLKLTEIDSCKKLVVAGKSYSIRTKEFEAIFPSDAFYRDVLIETKTVADNNYLSDIITVGETQIPVHKNYILTIAPKNHTVPTSKMLVLYLEKGKAPASIGGKFEEGKVKVSTRKLGRFAISADTVSPEIRPLNFYNGLNVDTLKSLRVEIKDALSGIESFYPTLNGKWILMDYDAKNNLLVYIIDEQMVPGDNTFKLEVSDQYNNKKVFEAVLKKSR